MKKIIAIIVISIVLLSFSGCATDEDKAIAINVAQKIETIGEVSLSKKQLITSTKESFDKLTKKQQRCVKNVKILNEALEKLDVLQREEDKSNIDNVIKKIDSIGEVILTSDDHISNARKLYDKLRDDLKQSVTNYAVLIEAEKKISELKIENANKLIAAVKSSALEESRKIEIANDAYNSLSKEDKEKVVGYEQFKKLQEENKKLQQAEAEKAAKKAVQDIIRIERLWISRPDSVGGVELYINFTNKSNKTIKYLTFGVTFYNAVGDILKPDYANEVINYCQSTGPYGPGEGLHGSNWHWGKFYDSTIKSVELVYLKIDYTNGRSRTFTKDEIAYVQY